MLGFRFAGPKSRGDKHIIPFFGHTFNQDAWVPEANVNYFKVGKRTRYMPSEAWCSSFIGHDDNFGPNFCVPRLFVHPKQVQYVVELLRPNACYGGVVAETAGVNYLYSILKKIKDIENPWLSRLSEYVKEQKVVLRAVFLTKEQYMSHLRHDMDWKGINELPELCNSLEKSVPSAVWGVEVSIPQLFPANLRKLGEIVLNATVVPKKKRDLNIFLFARFPEMTMFLDKKIVKGRAEFLNMPSSITSHLPLFQHK